MYRKIFRAERKEDLSIELPGEYLNKNIEVIAFQVVDDAAARVNKKADMAEAMKFFDSMHADLSNFKFNRDEANER